ncbi:MAG: AsmA-like C-terminal region-containing protein [Bryobacteraceae bacterium]
MQRGNEVDNSDRRPLIRWFLTGAVVIAICLGLSAIMLVMNWPFTQAAVAKALQDRFARTVHIQSFRGTYFPPGCVAEGVSFEHRKRTDLPPLITVRTLTIKASYADLLRAHKRVGDVEVAGLHILVPPARHDGKPHSIMPLTESTSGKSLEIGEIMADGAVVEFRTDQPGKEPLTIRIHRLTLDHVGEKGPISFHASLLNPEPPGEILAEGQVGPWNADEPGSVPLSGSYSFDKGNLNVFKDLGGILSSKGKFSGTLDRIDCQGTVDVPDFRVSKNTHAVHLATEFHAAVDAANGDTTFDPARSHFQQTTIVSKGGVMGHAGRKGKAVALDVNVTDGRIDDLLRLFADQARPSMTGRISLRAKAELPPGPEGFLQKLSLQGDFGVAGGKFTNIAAQAPINRLSDSARGENKQQEAADPATALSNLKGHVIVKDGIATFSNVSCNIPGAFAEMRGTYNLLSKNVDLQGVLHTTGKLSDTTSGLKALVLKVASPFLKKNSVTVVPFTIKGTAKQPAFSLDFDGKRHM